MQWLNTHGYKLSYLNNQQFREWVNLFGALAMIPLANFDEAMTIVEETMPSCDDIDCSRFLAYFQRQWIDGQWPKETWNHGDQEFQHATNNHVEAYNKNINAILVSPKPSIWKFCKFVKNEDDRAAVEMQKQLNDPLRTNKKSRKQKEKENQTAKLREAFKNNSITLRAFMRGLANVVDFPQQSDGSQPPSDASQKPSEVEDEHIHKADMGDIFSSAMR